jgi:hypothetical protein
VFTNLGYGETPYGRVVDYSDKWRPVVPGNVWSPARLQGKSEVAIDRSAQMYSAFDGEQSLLAMMSCAACSS